MLAQEDQEAESVDTRHFATSSRPTRPVHFKTGAVPRFARF